MIRWSGGKIVNGKTYIWTNLLLGGFFLDESVFLNACYCVSDEWLGEMFDNKLSAYLMPMPRENWN